MTLLLLWLASAGIVAGEGEFVVQTVDGRNLSGQVQSLSQLQLRLQAASGAEVLPLETVLDIRRATKSAAESSSLVVELMDGSRLAATAFTARGGVAHITLSGGEAIEIPSKQLRLVRLRGLQDNVEALAGQWSEIAAANAAADLLVIRKNEALDHLEGVLGSIDAAQVEFELDGEKIPVKRTKIEGWIYFHPQTNEAASAAVAELSDVNGTTLAAAHVMRTAENWEILTVGGLKLSWPDRRIARVDYSSGKLRYLSDLEPESTKYEPYLAIGGGETPSLIAFFQPRRDRGFAGGALSIGGKAYRKGLALVSRSEVVYRLDGKFGHFLAFAGIDDAVTQGGDVALEILADGRSLWEGSLRGGEAAKPLELDVGGAKRLTILVDYGEDLDVGDYLTLGDAKVTK